MARPFALALALAGLGGVGVPLAQGGQPGPADYLGHFQLTYYYVAQEQQPGTWPLYGEDCAGVLARTSAEFHSALSREGSGWLMDGRVINFESRCTCARPGHGGQRNCYSQLDGVAFPWGRGAWWGEEFLPLRPFYSLAVDPERIPIGTVLYLPELAGVPRPDGHRMNGCFRAEDTGSAVRGSKVDFFVGTEEWMAAMQRTFKLNQVHLYAGDRYCSAKPPGG